MKYILVFALCLAGCAQQRPEHLYHFKYNVNRQDKELVYVGSSYHIYDWDDSIVLEVDGKRMFVGTQHMGLHLESDKIIQ